MTLKARATAAHRAHAQSLQRHVIKGVRIAISHSRMIVSRPSLKKEVRLSRVPTDRGTGYCGNPEHHEYELYLAVEDIPGPRRRAHKRMASVWKSFVLCPQILNSRQYLFHPHWHMGGSNLFSLSESMIRTRPACSATKPAACHSRNFLFTDSRVTPVI